MHIYTYTFIHTPIYINFPDPCFLRDPSRLRGRRRSATRSTPCIYIYLDISIYTYIYVYVHAHIHTHIHTHTHTYIYINFPNPCCLRDPTRLRGRRRSATHSTPYIYIYISIYTHIHMYIYVHIYIHIHTHTHTYIYKITPPFFLRDPTRLRGRRRSATHSTLSGMRSTRYASLRCGRCAH